MTTPPKTNQEQHLLKSLLHDLAATANHLDKAKNSLLHDMAAAASRLDKAKNSLLHDLAAATNHLDKARGLLGNAAKDAALLLKLAQKGDDQ